MRATTLIALTAVAILAVGLLFGGSYVLSSLSDCSGKERAILERYPHYGNRRIATYPWTSCSIRYTTNASRKEVLVYYDESLRKHGWRPVKPPYSPYRAAHPFKRGDHGNTIDFRKH